MNQTKLKKNLVALLDFFIFPQYIKYSICSMLLMLAIFFGVHFKIKGLLATFLDMEAILGMVAIFDGDTILDLMTLLDLTDIYDLEVILDLDLFEYNFPKKTLSKYKTQFYSIHFFM